MQISEAKYIDGWLMLKIPSDEALPWLYGFAPNNKWSISKAREKPSRSANNYAWQLMTEIGRKLNISKEEVYRHQLQNIGGVTDIISVRPNAVQDFVRRFKNNHVGRQVEILSEAPDWIELLCTYGSSDFTKEEMSNLIESITEDCKSLGILTLDDYKMRGLLEDWDKRWKLR